MLNPDIPSGKARQDFLKATKKCHHCGQGPALPIPGNDTRCGKCWDQIALVDEIKKLINTDTATNPLDISTKPIGTKSYEATGHALRDKLTADRLRENGTLKV